MKKYRIIVTFFAVSMVASFTLSSCLKHEDIPTAEDRLQQALDQVNKTQLEADLKIIDDTLAQRHIEAQTEPNGVRYVIHTQGTGPKPALSSYITFSYTGRLLATDSIFDSGTISYSLEPLILGFQTTLPLMNEGTKATLYIPSGLGYGAYDYPSTEEVVIPANSILVFDIELLDVQ